MMNNVIPLNQPPADALGLMASLCGTRKQAQRRERRRRRAYVARQVTLWVSRILCFSSGLLAGLLAGGFLL